MIHAGLDDTLHVILAAASPQHPQGNVLERPGSMAIYHQVLVVDFPIRWWRSVIGFPASYPSLTRPFSPIVSFLA